MRRALLRFSAAAAGAAVAAAAIADRPARAEDFYAGKTIDFVVGSNPGGGYDIYARAIARYLNRYVPGKPNVVVKNLPGAGSAKAAAFMYAIAPKDGTTIGAIFPGAVMDPLLGDQVKAQYDPTKFQYLATADNSTRTCVIWHTSPTKTYADAMTRKTVLGASQAGGSTRDYGYMSNKLTGTKFDIVSGYKGSVDILLAMERGEVDGMCGYDWSSMRTQRPDWLRDRKVNIVLQVGLEPQGELTAMRVPELWKFIKNDEDRKVAELVVSQQIFGRPYFAPPETPSDRVEILRAGFAATMKDKDFLEEASRSRLDVEPLPGRAVQQAVEKIYATPSAIVERAKQVIKP
jgi:tripartite-type tricarboxylate transporter receptor subunit TctC